MPDDPEFDSPIAPKMLERADDVGVDHAETYEVTTVVSHQEQELVVNEYTFEVDDLDAFFMGYQDSPEVVVDVRPLE